MRQATPAVSRPPADLQSLTIAEYGGAEAELSFEKVSALARLAGHRLTVLPGRAPGRWRIKASSYVGTVVTPELKVLVVPKVATANLFHLLEAGGRPLAVGAETYDYDTTGDLMPSFATFYARHLEIALGHGLPRGYRGHDERLFGL
jgi:5-methylcytosine-specific restriction enzyme subunit McrC